MNHLEHFIAYATAVYTIFDLLLTKSDTLLIRATTVKKQFKRFLKA
jgi:hypothetical protein